MLTAMRAYWRSVWKHSLLALSGAVAGAFGVALEIHPLLIPSWFWFLLAIAAAFWIGFLAFWDTHKELVALQSDAGAAELRDYVEQRLNDSLSRLHLELTRTERGQENMPDLVAEMNLASSLVAEAFGPLEAMKLHVPTAGPSEFFDRFRTLTDRFPTMQVRRDFDRSGFERVKEFYEKKPRSPGINVMFKAASRPRPAGDDETGSPWWKHWRQR